MATRAGLNHGAILTAAEKLINEHGLDSLTMATLAATVNVRTPTLYHYFHGLSDIKRSLALRGLREMSTQLGRAVMGKSGDAAVIALAYALHDFAREHPGLYEATARAPEGADPEWQSAGTEVVDIGARALSAYHLSSADALHTIRILRSIVHGFVSLDRAGGFALPLDTDETFRRLIDVVLLYLHDHHLPKDAAPAIG